MQHDQIEEGLMSFLSAVITTDKGWLRVFDRLHGDSWYPWPDLSKFTLKYPSNDLYFSPHLYTGPTSKAQILPTRTVALDIQSADITDLPLLPTFVVFTSPAPLRLQAYFVFHSIADEDMSKQMVLTIDGADHLSYPFGALMRLPYTFSTKYSGSPYPITIQQDNRIIHGVESLLPSANGHRAYTQQDLTTLLKAPTDPDPLKPQRYLESLQLSPTSSIQYNVASGAPEHALRNFILECLRKGVPKPNILSLCKASANNHFKGLGYYENEELAKLILYLETRASEPDATSLVRAARNQSSTLDERHEAISSIVLQTMKQSGAFHHTRQNTLWYVPKDDFPISITRHSSQLENHLNHKYTLNSTDPDTAHVIADITAAASKLPKRVNEAKLSYYDAKASRLLIHTGAPIVFSITPDRIEQVANGSYDVLFRPMDDIFTPFMPRSLPIQITWHEIDPQYPDKRQTITRTYEHWSHALFDTFDDTFLNLDQLEARSILSTWLLFILFKNAMPSRPLLAILGAPGSGKSTLPKRIHTLLYGKLSGILKVSGEAAYDQAAYAYPLMTLDNLDTWDRWMADCLAQSAGSIDAISKKLYTDGDTFIKTKDAMVCITAHDPKFSRADIADRLLILRKTRFKHFVEEQDLMELPRAAIWWGILQDLATILATPKPVIPEELRIQDFAATGAWIAAGLGPTVLQAFRSALTKLKGNQQSFALEGDAILTDALLQWSKHKTNPHTFLPATTLYQKLEFMVSLAGDPAQFTRKYRNASALSNRLFGAMEAIKSVVNISYQDDAFSRKEWLIEPKG